MQTDPTVDFKTKQLPAAYDYLAPDGSEIRLLAEVQGGGLCHCTMPAGGVSKAVSHRTVEEIWYCLSGRGQVWRRLAESEECVDVSPGISLSIPVGTAFQFRTIGSEPLCFLIVTIPRWPGPEEALPAQGAWEAVFVL
jgi:mannose-6-phosphate isomerase-like protein (cupin superfamily)